MKKTLVLASVTLAGGAIIAGQLSADARGISGLSDGATPSTVSGTAVQPGAGTGGLDVQPIGGGVGPDVILGGIPSIVQWGANLTNTIVAYSFATTSCNVGTTQLLWQQTPDSDHPVIGQSLYRMHGGRMEQIGQAWLKHSFCALQQGLCGACGGGGGCQSVLHPGCSDPYTASRNGFQPGLGPKQHVNAATGVFSASPSFVTPAAIPGDNNNVHGRLQAAKADLYNVNYPGARYFIEGSYTANDDAAAGNNRNNTSWRELAFAQPTPAQFPTWTFPPSLLSTGAAQIGGTNREQTVLRAWREFDSGTAGPAPSQSTTIRDIDVPGEGRFHLGYKVTNNGDGTWTYEYALQNVNSDRSAQSFSVPNGDGVVLSNFGFHDVFYHWHFNPVAGQPAVPQYSGVDWPVSTAGGNVSWSTETFAVNPNANAIRWGTTYNFRFTASTPPQVVTATIGLFKPGAPNSVTVSTHGPANGTPCPADLNGDGVVDGLDLGTLLAQWSGLPGSPVCPCSADLDGNGVVDGLDLGQLLADWSIPAGSPGCQ